MFLWLIEAHLGGLLHILWAFHRAALNIPSLDLFIWMYCVVGVFCVECVLAGTLGASWSSGPVTLSSGKFLSLISLLFLHHSSLPALQGPRWFWCFSWTHPIVPAVLSTFPPSVCPSGSSTSRGTSRPSAQMLWLCWSELLLIFYPSPGSFFLSLLTVVVSSHLLPVSSFL